MRAHLNERAGEAKLVDKVGRDEENQERREVKRTREDRHELVEPVCGQGWSI